MSQATIGSRSAQVCFVLGLLALVLCLASLADLPNRLRVTRSISLDVEAGRRQSGYLVSLSVALITLLTGWSSRKAGKSRGLRHLGLLCAACSVAMALPFLDSLRHGGERWECVNNLKQIQLALLNYDRDFGAFPPRVTRGRVGRPLLSWRVLIHPYLEQKELHSRFHLDEP